MLRRQEMNIPRGIGILFIHGFVTMTAYDQQMSSKTSDSPLLHHVAFTVH